MTTPRSRPCASPASARCSDARCATSTRSPGGSCSSTRCSPPTSSRCSPSATFVPLALVLLLGAGWPAAALVSAAVIVVETGSLTFLEVAESVRRSWRRGLVLAVRARRGGRRDGGLVPLLRRRRDARLAARGRRPLPGRDLPPLPAAALAARGAGPRQTARRRRGRGRDRAPAPAAAPCSGSGSRCWWSTSPASCSRCFRS